MLELEASLVSKVSESCRLKEHVSQQSDAI